MPAISRTNCLVAALMAMSLMPTSSLAQRAGDSISVQYGTVIGTRQVDLKSGAVPKGALVGGTLGLVSASGKSSGKKVRNTIIGTAAGGLVAGRAQGSTTGMMYRVDTGASGEISVVTDQLEIRSGDCVAVEKAGETANIRRVSAAYCDRSNESAVRAVQSEAKQEAEECLAAKSQLVNASTTEAADLAARKVQLLCND